jgi:tetratricopeptide (TPR) repeat protein
MAQLPPRPPRSDPAPALNEALTLHRQGRLDEAEKAYTRLLKAYPGHYDVLRLLGVLKQQRGKTGEAFRFLSAAVKIVPNAPDALASLAVTLHALKRSDEALVAADKALAADPLHADALINRANILVDLHRADEARASLDPLLAAQPNNPQALLARGNAAFQSGRHADALADYDAALGLMPGHPSILYNRANALFELGQLAPAIESYDRVLAITPQHKSAWNNRGNALTALNRPADAVASFERAIALDAKFSDAQYNLAAPLLLQGDFARGLEKYEWRWKRTVMAAHTEALRRTLDTPLWLGQTSLANKTILLHAEQGLGDTLQFVRYLPAVAAMAGAVILEVQSELKDLLSVMPGLAPRVQVVARDAARPRFDLHCPLGSLPLALKTRPESIPADVPYLSVPDAAREKWRTRLGGGDKPLVALAWAGRSTHANDRNRSLSFAALAPLLARDDVTFMSLQKDLRAGESEAIDAAPHLTPIGDALDDFTDTAAVVSLVDLVIAVDTAVVHLAGALARPVWVMLPFAPDWRWQLQRSDSPWYPTARLFRQPRPGDWAGVVGAVDQALAGQFG